MHVEAYGGAKAKASLDTVPYEWKGSANSLDNPL
jgi:hypothetical protein